MVEQNKRKTPDYSIIADQEIYARIQRRFQYLDGLTREPNKMFYINGLVPSVFTHDLPLIERDDEESQRAYQRACRLFVSYLRDIYANLIGEEGCVKKALKLDLIDEYTKTRLMDEMLGIDQAVPEQEILDGKDILTGKNTSFFIDLTRLENSLEFQRKVVSLGQELSFISTRILLAK